MDLILYLLFGYLVGSIPFGLLITQKAGLGDIRKIGSGNIGATNVLRTGNKKLAAATLAADMLKAFIPALIVLFLTAREYAFPGVDSFVYYGHAEALITGLGAVIGHCFPVWLKFKGGKGVATSLGALLAATPYVGLMACIVWLATAFFTRISSLSALTAIALAPILVIFFYGFGAAVVCALISALVIYKHMDNIDRIIKGQESKIDLKAKEQKKEPQKETKKDNE